MIEALQIENPEMLGTAIATVVIVAGGLILKSLYDGRLSVGIEKLREKRKRTDTAHSMIPELAEKLDEMHAETHNIAVEVRKQGIKLNEVDRKVEATARAVAFLHGDDDVTITVDDLIRQDSGSASLWDEDDFYRGGSHGGTGASVPPGDTDED